MPIAPGQKYLSEEQIGEIVGVSRQRVAKLAGPRGSRPERGIPAYLAPQVHLKLDAGHTQRQILTWLYLQTHELFTPDQLGAFITKHFGPNYMSISRSQRRRKRIEAELREFIEHSNRDLTHKFLEAWKPGLARRAVTVMSLAEWAAALGVRRTLWVRNVPVVRREDVLE